ncbi:unnamed protein product [Urochloa humidicola]
MGNCSPLPCPSPCPDLSFQEICANNNCHGCCIFHCSRPTVPTEAPAWDDDSPLAQTRQLPHLPPPRPGTARGIGGVAQDDVPSYGGYRIQPSPWGTESGSVATVAKEHHDSGSRVAPPAGVLGNGDRPVPPSLPSLAWSGLVESCAAGNDGGSGVPRHVDRLAPPSRRTDQHQLGSAAGDGRGVARIHDQPLQSPWRAETWTASGRDASAVARDMPVAAPHPGLTGAPATGRDDGGNRSMAHNKPGHRVQSPRRALSAGCLAETRPIGRHAGAVAVDMPVATPRPGLTGATGCGGDAGSRSVAHNTKPCQPVQSPRRALSGCLAETWAIGGAVAADMPAIVVESGKHSSPPSIGTQQGRLPSPSLSATGRLSPAESRHGLPRGCTTSYSK